MKPERNRYLGILARVWFGISLLFVGYRVFRFELGLQRYEKAFLHVEYPANTTRLDSLQFEITMILPCMLMTPSKGNNIYLVYATVDP